MKFFWKKFNFNPTQEWGWERMKLEFLVSNYNIISQGIAHIGGWKCEEVHKYKKLFGDIPVVFVEPNNKLKPFIDENLKYYKKVRCEYVALGNKDSQVFLNLNFSNPDNDDIGQSSSVLEPLLHPPIGTRKVEVEMTTADKLFKEDNVDFLSIDVEGHELEVIKGLNFEKFLPKKTNKIHTFVSSSLTKENQDSSKIELSTAPEQTLFTTSHYKPYKNNYFYIQLGVLHPFSKSKEYSILYNPNLIKLIRFTKDLTLLHSNSFLDINQKNTNQIDITSIIPNSIDYTPILKIHFKAINIGSTDILLKENNELIKIIPISINNQLLNATFLN